MSWQSLETRDDKKTYQSTFLMIMKEKLPFRFEEHTLQFTLKIALNIEMQSNLFNCVREAENLGQDPTVSLYDYMKRTGIFVENLIYYSTPVKDNITNNTERLILGEKVETFRDRKAIFSYLCLKIREVYRPEILFEENHGKLTN